MENLNSIGPKNKHNYMLILFRDNARVLLKYMPCDVCGVWSRALVNEYMLEVRLTKAVRIVVPF